MYLNLAKISNPKSEISNPNSEIRTPKSIQNLIFDFGGVICNIDAKLTEKAFIALGLKQFDTGQSIADSAGLFEKLETGTITPKQFRDELRLYFGNPVTDEQLDAAWNALLLDIPEPRIRMIEALRQNHRIFLLSNSNEIHYLKYNETFRNQYGYDGLEGLFEKAWFSFRIGLKKPGTEIFRFVLKQADLDPEQTLFIDDTLKHVEGARAAGMHAIHLDLCTGAQVTDLFLPG
jgi:putative hydrolase of the HAD superfamily